MRAVIGTSPPPRPPLGWELASQWLFLFLSPRLPRRPLPPTPPSLEPAEELTLDRGYGPGTLSATWFPATGPARGAVLLLHPWLMWGRSYFHRHGRLEALRAAGYHALTLDLPGFGDSGPPAGYFERAVEDGLGHLAARSPGLPRHVWGVSSGGYWAHLALSRLDGISGAMFEDVSPHLLEWSWRMAPWGRPGYLIFRTVFHRAYRYLDLRRHTPHLRLRRVGYASGSLDRGVRPEDTRELARRAGAPCLVVPGAGHLQAIKVARQTVIDLALETFRQAEADAGEEWPQPREVAAARAR